jgi:murein DD-endopeptidase MepM/ murein hydrolase activator NlpD
MGVVGLGSAAAAPRRHIAPVPPRTSIPTIEYAALAAPSGDGILLAHDAAGRARLAAAATAAASDRAARASRARARAALPAFVRPGTGVLTSCFCWRWGAFHDGIDLAAPLGAPIFAATAGVVTKAGPERGYGNLIVIQHAGNTVTFYGHEEKILVKVGQHVAAGQRIALVGNLGFSTGPHLHFGVKIGAVAVDPIPWLKRQGVKI